MKPTLDYNLDSCHSTINAQFWYQAVVAFCLLKLLLPESSVFIRAIANRFVPQTNQFQISIWVPGHKKRMNVINLITFLFYVFIYF